MLHRTRIKMCGITHGEDALKAVELGVDAVGFIFAVKSPRYIAPETARTITKALPPFISPTGVFVNEKLRDIVEIAHYLGLKTLQLHGAESPSFCEKLARALPSVTVVKAFRVGPHCSASDFMPYNDAVGGFLLDTYVPDQEGGTGIAFDWHILSSLQLHKPCILAGGLSPKNIRAALEVARPYGVDVNSGVEYRPGVKDHESLVRFVIHVREYDAIGPR
ncbi:MAG: phosphoribosylanthranilate isomerase [Desulfopila sp.]